VRRTLCYLLRTVLPVVVLVAALFPVAGLVVMKWFTHSAEGLFYNYYQMFPAICVFVNFLFMLNVTSITVNMALSMGRTRREVYWAVQGLILAAALSLVLLAVLVLRMPALLNARWIPAVVAPDMLPTLFLVALLGAEAGAFGGYYAGRHRWLMVVLFLGAAVLLGAATVLFLLADQFGTELSQKLIPWINVGCAVVAVMLGGLNRLPLRRYIVR